jgi:hypothetical protein
MAFVTGRFYTFDCSQDPGMLSPGGVASSLAEAQENLNERLARDRRSGSRFHYEILERTAGGFTLRQTNQS